MLNHLFLFCAVIYTSDTGSTYAGACTRDKWISPFYPLLTYDSHAPKAFSLRYVFLLLGIVYFVLFRVSWHRWAPSGSRIRRVGLRILDGINRWLNPFFSWCQSFLISQGRIQWLNMPLGLPPAHLLNKINYKKEVVKGMWIPWSDSISINWLVTWHIKIYNNIYNLKWQIINY